MNNILLRYIFLRFISMELFMSASRSIAILWTAVEEKLTLFGWLDILQKYGEMSDFA